MEVKIFSLYDLKAQVFTTPFFMIHTGQAVRACIDLGTDQRTTVGRYPNDFTLYQIGVFDDQTGTITSLPPNPIAIVAQLLPQQPALPMFDPSSEQRPNGQSDNVTN